MQYDCRLLEQQPARELRKGDRWKFFTTKPSGDIVRLMAPVVTTVLCGNEMSTTSMIAKHKTNHWDGGFKNKNENWLWQALHTPPGPSPGLLYTVSALKLYHAEKIFTSILTEATALRKHTPPFNPSIHLFIHPPIIYYHPSKSSQHSWKITSNIQ